MLVTNKEVPYCRVSTVTTLNTTQYLTAKPANSFVFVHFAHNMQMLVPYSTGVQSVHPLKHSTTLDEAEIINDNKSIYQIQSYHDIVVKSLLLTTDSKLVSYMYPAHTVQACRKHAIQ